MKEILIGDCHFGTHTNKTLWLKSQIDFFNNQVIPYIESVENLDRVVFLGDLFDIRYSTNTQVGIEVKNIIRKILKLTNVIMIAGNHDYYSPLKELDYYNVYDLVFGDEFLDVHKNLKIVSKEPYLDNRTLFLPWYYTEEKELWDDVCKKYNGYVDIIYCHSDLCQWGHEKLSSIGYPKVFSGHIHYPWSNKDLHLENIGACMSYDFNDVNGNRHIWLLENGIPIYKLRNDTTPKFKRFYNEQIFKVEQSDVTNSFVELCVAQSKINTARYIEQINFLKSNLEYFDMRTKMIDDNETYEDIPSVSFNTNINTYIEDNIPDHLRNKFEIIKDKLKETK